MKAFNKPIDDGSVPKKKKTKKGEKRKNKKLKTRRMMVKMILEKKKEESYYNLEVKEIKINKEDVIWNKLNAMEEEIKD